MKTGFITWRLAAVFAVAVALVAFIDVKWATPGEYSRDAQPAIDALASGNLHTTHAALMGSFSLLLRAPFVAVAHLAGAGETASYRAGVFPCLLIAALLGVALSFWSPAVRSTRGAGILVVLLACATPSVLDALELGHPEEVLAASLGVGAVVLAKRGRITIAAVTLGLAVATKQWAVLAIPPTIVALPGHRVRATVVAGAVAAALTVFQIVENASGFAVMSRQAASAPPVPSVESWWYLFGQHFPAWLSQASHPAIIALSVPFTAVVARRQRPDVLLLLAILLLVRCVLDPANNYYYHVPLILAILAWEIAERGRALPYVTLSVVASLAVTFNYLLATGSPNGVVFGFYFAWTLTLAGYLCLQIARQSLSEPRFAGVDRVAGPADTSAM